MFMVEVGSKLESAVMLVGECPPLKPSLLVAPKSSWWYLEIRSPDGFLYSSTIYGVGIKRVCKICESLHTILV